jgi:beta-phosphoglucomutase-like phosphatase (HAD superfamily)
MASATRAVVFDFDGVIANSEPLHYLGFRDVLAEEGIEPERSTTRLPQYDDAEHSLAAADRGGVAVRTHRGAHPSQGALS